MMLPSRRSGTKHAPQILYPFGIFAHELWISFLHLWVLLRMAARVLQSAGCSITLCERTITMAKTLQITQAVADVKGVPRMFDEEGVLRICKYGTLTAKSGRKLSHNKVMKEREEALELVKILIGLDSVS